MRAVAALLAGLLALSVGYALGLATSFTAVIAITDWHEDELRFNQWVFGGASGLAIISALVVSLRSFSRSR